jgi:hypothetical protein
MFKQVEVLVRFPCFILYGFKIDDLLCQKFWDSKIEMNGEKIVSLFLIPARQLHVYPLWRFYVLLIFNLEKEGRRKNWQTKHPEERLFFHLCPSDLKSSLLTLFEFICVTNLFGPDRHTMWTYEQFPFMPILSLKWKEKWINEYTLLEKESCEHQ